VEGVVGLVKTMPGECPRQPNVTVATHLRPHGVESKPRGQS
jgi:hypothetical protein